MRLADQLLAERGSSTDGILFGAITSLTDKILQAQRFELFPDVADACRQVSRTKPSSMVSALPFTRLPYPITWLEWQSHCPENYQAKAADRLPDGDLKPQPQRMGCLCEAADASLRHGTLTWAWFHKESGCNVAPFGCYFDWNSDADLPALAIRLNEHVTTKPKELAEIEKKFPGMPSILQGVSAMAAQARELTLPAVARWMVRPDSRWPSSLPKNRKEQERFSRYVDIVRWWPARLRSRSGSDCTGLDLRTIHAVRGLSEAGWGILPGRRHS
jgi:hypothetical protein